MEVTAVDKKKYEQYIQGTIRKYKAAKQDLEIKFRYVTCGSPLWLAKTNILLYFYYEEIVIVTGHKLLDEIAS